MEYQLLGQTGVRVSQICLGTMNFGGPTDRAASLEIIGRAFDAGVNFWDTANVYTGGASERIVGEALKGRRAEVVLATKCGLETGSGPNDRGLSRRAIVLAVEESLKRLDTDYVDILYVHRPDPDTPIEQTLAALDDLVRAGKALYVAASNFRAWQLGEALRASDLGGLARFVAVQPLYNIANRDIEVELLPLCAHEGLGVAPYSPIARGVLTGKYRAGEAPPPDSRAASNNARLMQTEYREANFQLAEALGAIAAEAGCSLAQLAVAWVMANPIVTAPIIGPRTMEHLEDNLGALDVAITPEIEAAIDALAPPGEHSGKGYVDPLFPVAGRPVG